MIDTLRKFDQDATTLLWNKENYLTGNPVLKDEILYLGKLDKLSLTDYCSDKDVYAGLRVRKYDATGCMMPYEASLIIKPDGEVIFVEERGGNPKIPYGFPSDVKKSWRDRAWLWCLGLGVAFLTAGVVIQLLVAVGVLK